MYSPGRVMGRVHPDYSLCELKDSLARLSCLDDASKVVCGILVCGWVLMWTRRGMRTRPLRTLLVVEDGGDRVDVLVLADWNDVRPLRIVCKQV